jgi:acetylornithine deacetylase
VNARMSAAEAKLAETIRSGREDLVALVRDLIGFDTTTVGETAVGCRQEHALQEYLADRLRTAGLETELWEPDLAGYRPQNTPSQIDFAGRPQLAARLEGSGRGDSLLLLGHVDCVPVEPIALWSTNPFHAARRDGRIYGRGAADMKGGVASLLFALETLVRLGFRPRGDITFCSVTDEESSGAGSVAAVGHGVQASAGLCAENTGFDIWTACRGSVVFEIEIEGRAGHAECRQPDWKAGGAVNAIDKTIPILQALSGLGAAWSSRPDLHHPLLPAGDAVVVGIHGGEWEVTYPSRCTTTVNIQFLPHQVSDSDGIDVLREEVEHAILAVTESDEWLANHPPKCSWRPWVIPGEMDAGHPLVGLVSDCARKVGREAPIRGLDSWHDPANFIRLGETPTLSFGPGLLACSHITDEWVSEEDLVDHCIASALILLDYCG